MSIDLTTSADFDLGQWTVEPLLVFDPRRIRDLIAERREIGADRFDEVWEGQYRMSPSPSNRHYRLCDAMVRIFEELLNGRNAIVQSGGNVTDRRQDWTKNYRVPDVLVVLPGGKAMDCQEYYFGGPDFIVEVLSPGERPLEKLPFYASIGVREVLLVDRDTLDMELLRLNNDQLVTVGVSTQASMQELSSEVLPATFQVQSIDAKPTSIFVRSTINRREWHIEI